MTNPDREYRIRQQRHDDRAVYIEIAKHLYPEAKITDWSYVKIMDDGAFVDIVVWIPKSKVENEHEIKEGHS